MKIFITGASGFVGRNLLPYLEMARQCEISVLNLRSDWRTQGLEDCSAVIHLAGKAHDLNNVAQPDDYYQVNFELTKSLYDVFLESNAKKFIFISSVKAAADSLNDTLTEDISPCPKTHYGKSKLMAENYIQSQPLPPGKAFYILRPCMIHGPGNKGNLNLLYQFVDKGIPYPLAAFENKRSFLSVENLCFLIKELSTQENIPSGIYHAADDKPLSTNEVVKVLAKSLRTRPLFWAIPKSIIYGIAKIGNVLRLPLTTERLNKLTENYVVSNAKIKQALKIRLPVSAEEGLFKTANSFSKIK